MQRIVAYLTGFLACIFLISCSGPKQTQLTSESSLDPLSAEFLSREGTDWDDIPQAALEKVAQKQLLDEAEISSLVDPPKIETIRYVSKTEYSQVTVQCMAEQGFKVKPSQGGVQLDESFDTTSVSAHTLNLAWYTCAMKYPMDPKVLVPLPRVRAEMLYEHEVNMLKPCIEKLGYKVPEPPSKQVWLDNYYGKSVEDNWNYLLLVPEDKYDHIHVQCPPEPKNLYGD